MLHVFDRTPSIISAYLGEMRDVSRQADRHRFRFNLERFGELAAYEISKTLYYDPLTVTTPLGEAATVELRSQPVLAPILRAALPMQTGFLRIFDTADSAFIAAYREHTHGDNFVVKIEYIAAPDLTDRTLILLDPMIATARSMLQTVEALRRFGNPARIIICGLIASEEGVEHLERSLPEASLYVGAVDNELTARGYIVPGLGDAGDLAYGPKN